MLWIMLTLCSLAVQAQVHLCEIYGYVYDQQTGHKIGAATVQVLQNRNVIQSMRTDSEGAYTTRKLLVPGYYRLRVLHLGYDLITTEELYIPGNISFYNPIGIKKTVTATDSLYGSDITGISGIFRDARTKRPIEDGNVLLISDDTIVKCTTDEDGVYAFKNMSSGLYRFVAYCVGCRDTVVEEVSIPARTVTEHHVMSYMRNYGRLRSIKVDTVFSDSLNHTAGWIKGRIVDFETQKPLVFVNVQVEQGHRILARTLTDTNGMYFMKVRTNVRDSYTVRTDYAEFKSSVTTGIVVKINNCIATNDIRLERGKGDVFRNVKPVGRPPLIDPDGKSGRTYTAEELQRLPVR